MIMTKANEFDYNEELITKEIRRQLDLARDEMENGVINNGKDFINEVNQGKDIQMFELFKGLSGEFKESHFNIHIGKQITELQMSQK